METIEFEGKTTKEAIANACKELNLSEEDMDIEVLEPGSPGIFGIVGGKKARIKVSVDSDTAAKAEEGDEEEEERGLAIARDTLEKILSMIPMEVTSIEATKGDGVLYLDVKGDKSGLLIGKNGRTLDALQFIVNKIVNKALAKRIQVVVDSENYRERKRDSLIQMALRMGEKAKGNRKTVATNLLNPRDRRIVHLALRDDKEIETKSRGEGELKKVLIIPKRQRSGKQQRT